MFKGKEKGKQRRAAAADANARAKEVSPNNNKKGNGDTDYSLSSWFKKQKGEPVASAVIAAAHHLTFEQLGVQTRNYRNSILYGGYGYLAGSRFSASVMPSTGPLSAVSNGAGRQGPHINLCNSIVNTILARLLTNGAPHVTFLTNDGDFELQHKAALLDQFNEGLMYQTDFDAVASKVALDCLVYGTGILKISVDATDNICAHRVFPNEVWAEAWDGREGRPRTIYQVTTEDRDVLAAQYPKFKKQIMAIRPMHPLDSSTAASVNTNVVAVWEAWHLPSPGINGDEDPSKGTTDGRHVKCLSEKVILEDEEWRDKDFPFIFLRFSDSLTGFWGLGVVELLWGHQSSMNSITRAEYQAHSQFSLPRIWTSYASNANVNHLLSSRSGMVLQSNEPPQILNWPAVSPDFVEWKNSVIASAYECIGVAQMSATGQIPAGLKSGAAIRDYMANQDIRFTVLSQKFGRFYCEAAEAMIRTAKRIFSEKKEFPVTVMGKDFIKTIDWSEIDLEEDEYVLKLYETSSLPRTPAGRLSAVQEMLQANLITPDMGRQLLQMPDMDDALGLANAAMENARMTAFELLHSDEPAPVPDPMQNIALCITTVTQEALKAINNKAPEWRVDRCRTWLEQAQALITPPTPPAPAPTPQANPAPPPVSDLIPNQPK